MRCLLLASEPPGDTSHAGAKKAVAILIPLFQQQPDHPGLAHYIIHSCDSPQMAPWIDGRARYAGNRVVVGARRPHAIAHFRPAGALAGGYPGKPQIGGADGAVERDIHARTRTARHALPALCYLQTGQDEAAKADCGEIEADCGEGSHDSDDTGMMEYFDYAQRISRRSTTSRCAIGRTRHGVEAGSLTRRQTCR